MKLFSIFSMLLFSLSSFANTFSFNNYDNDTRLCLATKDCFEHNGQIIDLRSPAKKMIDEGLRCDYSKGLCGDTQMYSKLSPTGVSKILGHGKEKSMFIPLSINQSDALLLLGSLSLGTIVFANDREVMDFVQNNKSQRTETVASIANLLGREAIIPIAAGAYFVGAVMDNGKLKQIGLFTISTGLATQLVTEVFKKTFQRVRPNESDSPYDFGEEGNNSFFSGHTSGAFSLATVIAETYKDNPIVPFLAYGAATLTAYARM
ncbi:MAG: phosphatase PAP2 family protein, partial [Bacteriovoracaceae bacterium]